MLNFKYLVRKRQIGDVLWIEPVIRQLAAKKQKVYVHTKYNELFENYPYPNVVFKNKLSLFEKIGIRIEGFLKTQVFFINLDMSYEKSPKEHFLHAYQRAAKVPITTEYPKLYLNNNEKENTLIPFDKYCILHLDSLNDKNYRRVYGINWEEVKTYLNDKGYKVVQVGKAFVDIGNGKIINTTLRDLIAIISKASFFIGIDSGPSHIAASLRIPSLLFFGSVNPYFRHFPELFQGYFLQQPCELAGCYHSSVNKAGVTCKLVGDEGVPKCSLHTPEFVKKNIDLLIKKFVNNA